MSEKTKVDPRTGEVITAGGKFDITKPPDPKTVSDINTVAGKNPRAVNLRDHPELDGMELYVGDVKFGSGDIGGKHTTYCVMAGFVCAPGKKPTEADAVMIITGADNIYSRIAQAYVEETDRKSVV